MASSYTRSGLLDAFYDAFKGRDVRVDNTFLGSEGAAAGNRGVLIDSDMAIDVTPTHNLSESQLRSGTRAFQSVAVLRKGRWGRSAPPQDHLDDLESFFLMLGWMCMKYDDTDVPRSPDFLNHWEDPNRDICANFKADFMSDPTRLLTAFFDTPIFHTLLESLAQFCDASYRRKLAVVKIKEPVPKLVDIHRSTDQGQDHDTFLAIIQGAIDSQKAVQETERQHTLTGTQFPSTQTNVEFVHPSNNNTTSPGTSSNPTGTKRPNPSSDDVNTSKRRRKGSGQR